jgi:hypothetical protein
MALTSRPATKPTAKQVDQICDALRKSNFRETAYASAGVSPYIVRNWIRAGVKDVSEGITDTLEAQLVQRANEAELEAEAKLIDGIREAGFQPFIKSESDKGTVYERGSWQALAWIAERRGAKRWGVKRHLTVDINASLERLVRVAEKVLEADQYDKLLTALAAEDFESDSSGEISATEADE